jgi:hypothetical protein
MNRIQIEDIGERINARLELMQLEWKINYNEYMRNMELEEYVRTNLENLEKYIDSSNIELYIKLNEVTNKFEDTYRDYDNTINKKGLEDNFVFPKFGCTKLYEQYCKDLINIKKEYDICNTKLINEYNKRNKKYYKKDFQPIKNEFKQFINKKIRFGV